MQCAILSSVACRAVQYFSQYLINDTIFEEKKVIEHSVCFDFLYNFFCEVHRVRKRLYPFLFFFSRCPVCGE